MKPRLGHSYKIRKYKAELIFKNYINESNNFKLIQMALVSEGKV